MPIGNLTSQILANVYLNELDRFIKHFVKPNAYLRYGDDFLVLADDYQQLKGQKVKITNFLEEELKLNINCKNDILVKAKQGVKFLGVDIFPKGRRLSKQNWAKINRRISGKNTASYYGLVRQHCDLKKRRYFNWRLSKFVEN